MAVKSLSPEDIKGKLLQGAFTNHGPAVSQLSDPIADTPMVVTLDQLKPYELNPRLNRNPMFAELKASIAARGLDAPPPISRRPGEEKFVIRNGGNTRLAILNELWTETRNEQFWRIQCLFRPWPERGDIVALTGHLAENDMKGDLTFVERALGIERAKELYQGDSGDVLSQRELARRLAADGYSISQSHISKMQDTVQYLLPAIPNVLYSGLGKPQIEKLISLRRNAEKTWLRYVGSTELSIDFSTLFTEVLALFDDSADFTYERVQDELIHQMQKPLGKEYNWLKLDILEDRAPSLPPVTAPEPRHKPASSALTTNDTPKNEPSSSPSTGGAATTHRPPVAGSAQAEDEADASGSNNVVQERIDTNTVTPIAGMTPRIQAMKRQLAVSTGEQIPDFHDSCLHSIPIQVGGLHPISDLWYIERQIDTPAELRAQIFGLVSEILNESEASVGTVQSSSGIGFEIVEIVGSPSECASSVLTGFLQSLGRAYAPLVQEDPRPLDTSVCVDVLAALVVGNPRGETRTAGPIARLSDPVLVKLFRVMRLARRLVDLEAES